MPVRNPPGLTSFDAAGVREAIEDALDGPLRSLVEYDADSFNSIYVDDVTLSFYEDEEHMHDHFERIHSYVHIDFTEMELFTDELFPVAEEIRYIATGLDAFTLIRVYVGDEGLFVAVDPDEDVEAIVAAVRRTVD